MKITTSKENINAFGGLNFMILILTINLLLAKNTIQRKGIK